MSHAKGTHHITAVAGDPQQNLSFYAGTLGLRLVKKTVNFDDPSVYHLYYGDKEGNPGTVLSFFAWPRLQQGHPDQGQAIAVSFSVPESSVDFWIRYFEDQDIDYLEPFERFGRKVIGFQDPDGLHLELIADPEAGSRTGWSNGSIPTEHAIRGLYGVTLAEDAWQPTAELLVSTLGYEEKGREHDRILLQSESEMGAAIEIIEGSELDGRPGKGTVHHVAFRAKDEEEQEDMRTELVELGYHVTEVKDRQYFQSIYFHEPGGILFEIATDSPGFTIDEPLDALGKELQLPSWLEERRDLIEAELPALSRPSVNKNYKN